MRPMQHSLRFKAPGGLLVLRSAACSARRNLNRISWGGCRRVFRGMNPAVAAEVAPVAVPCCSGSKYSNRSRA